jgi:hypothetical protein
LFNWPDQTTGAEYAIGGLEIIVRLKMDIVIPHPSVVHNVVGSGSFDSLIVDPMKQKEYVERELLCDLEQVLLFFKALQPNLANFIEQYDAN